MNFIIIWTKESGNSWIIAIDKIDFFLLIIAFGVMNSFLKCSSLQKHQLFGKSWCCRHIPSINIRPCAIGIAMRDWRSTTIARSQYGLSKQRLSG